MLVVAKPFTWTLESKQPRKTRSTGRYNDILSCIGKPKGSVIMSQKIAVSFHCSLCDFRQKPHGGIFTTSVAKVRVKIMTLLSVHVSRRSNFNSGIFCIAIKDNDFLHDLYYFHSTEVNILHFKKWWTLFLSFAWSNYYCNPSAVNKVFNHAKVKESVYT